MIKQIILHKFLLEKQNAIVCTAIIGGIILLFSTIATHTFVDETNTMRVSYDSAVSMASTAIWFCLIYTASRMFRDLSIRKTAIPFLMLPASNKDKFLANCIMGIGGTFAMFFIALIGADIIQALYNLALRYTTGSITVEFFKDLFTSNDGIVVNGVQVFEPLVWNALLIFWVHSIFTLGSTMFKKHSLGKTLISILGLFMAMMVILTAIVMPIINTDHDVTIHFLVDPAIMSTITGHAVIILSTIGAYYWAYRRFCSKTIL